MTKEKSVVDALIIERKIVMSTLKNAEHELKKTGDEALKYGLEHTVYMHKMSKQEKKENTEQYRDFQLKRETLEKNIQSLQKKLSKLDIEINKKTSIRTIYQDRAQQLTDKLQEHEKKIVALYETIKHVAKTKPQNVRSPTADERNSLMIEASEMSLALDRLEKRMKPKSSFGKVLKEVINIFKQLAGKATETKAKACEKLREALPVFEQLLTCLTEKNELDDELAETIASQSKLNEITESWKKTLGQYIKPNFKERLLRTQGNNSTRTAQQLLEFLDKPTLSMRDTLTDALAKQKSCNHEKNKSGEVVTDILEEVLNTYQDKNTPKASPSLSQ